MTFRDDEEIRVFLRKPGNPGKRYGVAGTNDLGELSLIARRATETAALEAATLWRTQCSGFRNVHVVAP